MYDFHTTITDEGAALLARIIANQENASFDEARFSDTDYTGQEQTLTSLTFGGVFDTNSVYAEIVDSTTIKVSFSILTQAQPHDLYSIGIIMDDNGTDVLVAVCTTADPMPVQQGAGNSYAFNVNLAVSSTSNITVTGTTAAVLYDTDVVDNLISTATNKPLSANQGRVIADNIAANENVYGAKNLNSYPYYETTKNVNGITFTDNGDGTITVSSGTASAATVFYCHYFGVGDFILEDGDYIINGCPSSGSSSTYCLVAGYEKSDNSNYIKIETGNGIEFSVSNSLQGKDKTYVSLYISIENGTAITNPITFKPMIRDARILDPTFAPFAKTNKQLTDDKAERDDLSTIHATGSTNTTGAQIDAGTFFYLNGQFCKALTNIAANATFTLNTNFEVTSVGGELKDALDYSGVYIFNATPAYEGWGGIYVPTPLPIPAKLLSGYTVTISDIKIGRNNGADITISINANDIYEKTHGGTSITYSLGDYFQSASPEFASFAALRNANASILVKLDVAHT